jgi:hypothetical protein
MDSNEGHLYRKRRRSENRDRKVVTVNDQNEKLKSKRNGMNK